MSARNPLKELEDALSFEASPDFCARVRQDLAAQPVRSPQVDWRHLAAAAVVILATAFGAALKFQKRGVDERREAGHSVAVSAVGSIAQRSPRANTIAPAVKQVRAAQPAPIAARSSFETLVPDDQLRALDSLLAAMRQGRTTVPPTVLEVEVNELGQRVPRALVIEPMKLEPLVKDPNK
jgi:hypothetical protein